MENLLFRRLTSSPLPTWPQLQFKIEQAFLRSKKQCGPNDSTSIAATSTRCTAVQNSLFRKPGHSRIALVTVLIWMQTPLRSVSNVQRQIHVSFHSFVTDAMAMMSISSPTLQTSKCVNCWKIAKAVLRHVTYAPGQLFQVTNRSTVVL